MSETDDDGTARAADDDSSVGPAGDVVPTGDRPRHDLTDHDSDTMTHDSTDADAVAPTVDRRDYLRGLAATALAGGAVASLPSPAGAATSDPVLFHRDFEDLEPGDWSVDESQWGGLNPWSVDTTYVDVATDDGDTVLDTQYPANQAGNGNGGVDMMVPFGQHYDELYHGYRVKFGEGFEFSNAGGKLPGLIGSGDDIYAVTGGDDPNGENGWSARMMWRDPPEEHLDRGGLVMFYVYHPDQPGEYGENMYWDDGSSGQVYFERGTWHEVEHRIVMNTPGEHDGILEGWFDGEKAFERRDLRFRDVPDLGINRFYCSAFFGGGNTQKWAHSREEHVYYDDFVVSEAPIWNGDGDGGGDDDGDGGGDCTDAVSVDGRTVCDPDGDDLYEDVDGNGELSHADVQAFFSVQHRPTWKQPQYFDFNGNSAVGHGDVLALFEDVATSSL